MNEQALLSELRNSLQATIFTDEPNEQGVTVRITKLLITEETQRAELTAKYVELLKAATISNPQV